MKSSPIFIGENAGPFSGVTTLTPGQLMDQFITACPNAMMAIRNRGEEREVEGFLSNVHEEENARLDHLRGLCTQARLDEANATHVARQLMLLVRSYQKIMEQVAEQAHLPPQLEDRISSLVRNSELWSVEQKMKLPKTLRGRLDEMLDDICSSFGIPKDALFSELFSAEGISNSGDTNG